MIPFKGVEGIKNLYLPKRCDICGKKREHTVLCGRICARCFVCNEWHRHMRYSVMKYFRFSIEKYLYSKVPRPICIPVERVDLVGKYNA